MSSSFRHARNSCSKNWRSSLNSVLDGNAELYPSFGATPHHHCSAPGKLQRMVLLVQWVFTAAVPPLIASNNSPHLARTGWPLSFNSRGLLWVSSVPTLSVHPCQHHGKFWRCFRSPTVCAPSPINHCETSPDNDAQPPQLHLKNTAHSVSCKPC
jgi:hypothetical protein